MLHLTFAVFGRAGGTRHRLRQPGRGLLPALEPTEIGAPQRLRAREGECGGEAIWRLSPADRLAAAR